jgi:hypothetical protein
LAYLLLAAVLIVVGVTAVLLRNRRPTSMNSSIEEFEKGLRAIAPDPEPGEARPDRPPRPPGPPGGGPDTPRRDPRPGRP